MIPVHRDHADHPWLQQALDSFPPDTQCLIAENDGEMAQALNEAIAQVQTEFTYFFAYDDIASEGLLEFLVDMAWNADVVYPSMRLTDEGMTRAIGDHPAEVFCGHRLLDWNYITGASLVRTEKLREVGGYRDLDSFEDWDLWVRLYRAGARFKPAPEAFFYYRQVEGSRNKTASYGRSKNEWRDLIVGDTPAHKATFYYQATPATAYWRCVLPARHLPGVATSDLEGAVNSDGHVEWHGHHGPTAVFQFAGSKDRAWCVANMPAAGIRTLIEVDDNYLDETDPVTRGRAGWGVTIGEKQSTARGHRAIVKAADGVIVTTDKLAEIYADVNPNVYVCRNSIDPADWPEPPGELNIHGLRVSPADDVFRIGWFASMSHDRDEQLVRRALSWASRQPGVQVVTMGYNPPWNFRRLHIPWSNDIAVYHRMMHLLDVGVCPVQRTGWSVCRSDLKALEYAMAGALPVMSAEPPYDPWRGLPFARFAHTGKDFEEQIRWAVRNQDKAKQQAQLARDHVLGGRLIQHEIPSWEKAVAA